MSESKRAGNRLQFSLGRLLLWTIAWAVFLGAARYFGYRSVLLLAYPPAIFLIRLKWPFERGVYFAAALAMGIYACYVFLRYVEKGRQLGEDLAFALASLPAACLLAILIGFYSMLAVDGLFRLWHRIVAQLTAWRAPSSRLP